ncbi:MAG TPA: undecaprenyldiphospho-muramoylpentapeptide beta-N-acetylglucosaminyltransferase [Thermoanaerobaculia bacterium]|nr:undecaprenyldiphospho-muramoylpentapeptide beta-N-acetylglucosaminyltransferase [Thermoanaerobaculia bacterium]
MKNEAGVLMIGGGGTGGHIYPALAIAREYVARNPRRRAVFVGTDYGLEKTLVPRAGFPLELISVGGLKGKSPAETIRNLIRLPRGFLQAWRLISRHRPSVILGVGGYASGPLLAAGAVRRIPTLIHEQNAFPGLTNRLLARLVSHVAVAFPEALQRLGREGSVTGNPVRQEFLEVRGEPLSLREGKSRLLLFGGSQGSRILNETMIVALLFLARLVGRLDIVHQTGPNDHARVSEAYRASPFPEARVVPWLDAMSEEMAAADLVVARAGAMTIGELCAVGRASILVPFALAANNHQEVNARVVEAAEGATVITERELTPEKLAARISELAADPDRTRRMGEAAKRLATPEATARIAGIIENIERI